ncbi:hypothetical protein C2869_11975 [Saccharobesus litoralis]|uniref:Orphan protein n=1 Tax=Saccharobesus litoralis TaxID=2172099 RepID=A0A2S0VSA9_9ALTE|nr:hypothetical protein [Saccharobesus litoralis]AWB67106.1 hypothetical protein C2869_11975 [Saccharobesus litoralis]
MRKLLAAPTEMNLSASDNQHYQNALKFVPDITLNLMAVKVDERATDFLSWCLQLLDICHSQLNMDLLEPEQLPVLEKFKSALAAAVSQNQIKMLRITPWPMFVGFIKQNAAGLAITERLRLLKHLASIKSQPLADMINEDRLAFAGKHTQQHDVSVYNYDVEWFGSTKAARAFHQLLNQIPEQFDKALDNIPLEGEVTQDHYQAFVIAYLQIFANNLPEEKPSLPAATRLLAMRRPDVFVVISNNKIDALCNGLSIGKFNNRDFQAYWQDLITCIQSCPWWRAPCPEIDHETSEESESEHLDETTLWRNRAILVDLFFYYSPDSAEKSNYLLLKNKPARAKSSATTTGSKRTRSKESIEVLVDRALAADDIPAYLKDKRESIISQVNAGKSVDQVISLLRSIFG